MKDRIQKLMHSCGMTQQNFASELCLAPATLSSIFNGRTKPTMAIVNAIHERFPEVNILWLQFGEGEMYVNGTTHGSGDAASTTNSDTASNSASPGAAGSSNTFGASTGMNVSGNTPVSDFPSDLFDAARITQTASQPKQEIKYIEKYIDKPVRKIKEIRVFYDDGTYETFSK